jgi:hypothetical protein
MAQPPFDKVRLWTLFYCALSKDAHGKSEPSAPA